MATRQETGKLRIFPPTYRGKYPHMFPLDAKVWERFLEKWGETYQEFAYDVKVGKPVKVFPHWEEQYKRDARILSKLRIDAVGFKEGRIDIIEVKPKLSASAVGQLLVYKRAFLREFNFVGSVNMVIVAGEGNSNVRPLLAENLIAYIEV